MPTVKDKIQLIFKINNKAFALTGFDNISNKVALGQRNSQDNRFYLDLSCVSGCFLDNWRMSKTKYRVYLTVAEAASALGISGQAVRQAVKEGKLSVSAVPHHRNCMVDSATVEDLRQFVRKPNKANNQALVID